MSLFLLGLNATWAGAILKHYLVRYSNTTSLIKSFSVENTRKFAKCMHFAIFPHRGISQGQISCQHVEYHDYHASQISRQNQNKLVKSMRKNPQILCKSEHMCKGTQNGQCLLIFALMPHGLVRYSDTTSLRKSTSHENRGKFAKCTHAFYNSPSSCSEASGDERVEMMNPFLNICRVSQGGYFTVPQTLNCRCANLSNTAPERNWKWSGDLTCI